jgi:hypothetical protein
MEEENEKDEGGYEIEANCFYVSSIVVALRTPRTRTGLFQTAWA